MRYRWHSGSFSWLIHRVTGVLLTFYIFYHLYALSQLKDPFKYESLLKLMESRVVKFGEVGLLGLAIAHGLNGIRLTLIDTGVPTPLQKPLFLTAVIIGGCIFILGAWPILRGVH